MSARSPALLGLMLACGTAAHADPIAEISHCAAVADRDERLACYDRLGARYAKAKPAAPATSAGLPPVTLPAAANSQAQPSAGAAPGAAPGAKATTPADSRADFGLANHQKPKEDPAAPKKLTAIEGTVTGFGHSSSGHMVVRLDDAQSWEFLAEADPMLAVGNKVTVRRALLGSFIMTTPSGRENRVKRLSAE